MTSNRDLLLPFAAPYLLYVGLGSVARFGVPPEGVYALRLVLVTLALAWAWRWYPPLTGPRNPLGSVGVGVVAGLGGTAVWVALLTPFVPDGGEPWGGAAFALRLVAATLLVPVFEELLMRGYLLRLALQWDEARRAGESEALPVALDERSILDVAPGAWSGWAVVLSTLAFTAGHAVPEWPASVAYGLLMAGLWIWRRDLLTCIVAHGVTNLTLAAYVWSTGSWGLW